MADKKNQIYSWILLLAAGTFYLFFAFLDGAVICVDSPTYIDMSITREFLYPSLLAIFREMFGQEYLLMIVVLQSILTAYVTWNVTLYFKKHFSLNYGLSSFIFLILICVSLLNRFVAGRGSMYSNSIMTEGITIPLFLLFFRYIYEYMATESRKAIVAASVLAGIMIATRKQMYISLVLLFLVILYKFVLSNNQKSVLKKWVFGIAKSGLVCISLILVVMLLDHSYNYVLRGKFVGHSSDNRFVLTMVFYTAEEEYVDVLPEELQPLFLEIYDKCDEQGYLMHSAGEGWYNNVVHFGDYYDLIQINTMWPAIQDYAVQYSDGDLTELQLVTDEITNVMIAKLMPKTAAKIGEVLFNNFLSGLVTTVAQRNHILIYYSVVVYAGYVALLGIYWKKAGELDGTVQLCLLTLLSIVVNVGLVSAVIFCQTRYTIYNMPLFYISGLILLREIYFQYCKK